jgi:hypothetical protein
MLAARVGGHRRGSPRYSYNAGSAGLVDGAGYPAREWGVIVYSWVRCMVHVHARATRTRHTHAHTGSWSQHWRGGAPAVCAPVTWRYILRCAQFLASLSTHCISRSVASPSSRSAYARASPLLPCWPAPRHTLAEDPSRLSPHTPQSTCPCPYPQLGHLRQRAVPALSRRVAGNTLEESPCRWRPVPALSHAGGREYSGRVAVSLVRLSARGARPRRLSVRVRSFSPPSPLAVPALQRMEQTRKSAFPPLAMPAAHRPLPRPCPPPWPPSVQVATKHCWIAVWSALSLAALVSAARRASWGLVTRSRALPDSVCGTAAVSPACPVPGVSSAAPWPPGSVPRCKGTFLLAQLLSKARRLPRAAFVHPRGLRAAHRSSPARAHALASLLPLLSRPRPARLPSLSCHAGRTPLPAPAVPAPGPHASLAFSTTLSTALSSTPQKRAHQDGAYIDEGRRWMHMGVLH